MIVPRDIFWNPMVPELSVTDFQRSVHFYVTVLGFEVMIRRESPDFVYLCLGDAQIMLEQQHDGDWVTGELTPPLGRGVNFQIEVVDVNHLVNRLGEVNYPLYRPVRDSYYNIGETLACQREFLVQDPDGYLLRFSQYIEDVNLL